MVRLFFSLKFILLPLKSLQWTCTNLRGIKLKRIFFYFPVTTLYDYVFPENGLVAYKNGELFHRQVSGIIIFILVSPYK